MRISTIFSLLFIAFVLTISCEKDDYSPIENPISPVIVDLASVPYQKLSDYQFFKAPLNMLEPVPYTHLRAHETGRNLVCRLPLEKKN